MRPIFILDDSEDQLELIRLVLEDTGRQFNVRYFDGPFDMLRALRTANDLPSLLLIDVKMPVIDGPEIVSSIRKIQGMDLIPVVMFSTSEQISDLKASRDAGANSYIIKPFGIENWTKNLIQTIDYWSNLDVYSKVESMERMDQ